jgi:TolA-binding protein
MQPRKFIGGMKRRTVAGLLLALVFICNGWLGFPACGAAKSPEDQAFQYAFDRFQDTHYGLAEKYFADFLSKYTNSPHRADAVLYLARARLEQSNYVGAIDLLQKSSAEADGLKHEYLFWIAKARYASGDLANAAEGFATVASEFPLSPRRLEAAYDQAEARSRMGDWPGVINLLQKANDPFQLAATQDPKSEFAAMGWLLLGEAFLHENRPADGEKFVLGFDPAGLTQDLRWHRQYLLSRLQLAEGRPDAALTTSTNVLELSLEPGHQAKSFFLQGEILEKLGRQAEALAVYSNNFVDSQPQEVQREALSRTIPLTMALNPLPQAIHAIQTLIDQHPQTKAQDLARVSLGELYLKAYSAPAGSVTESNTPSVADTNLLFAALTNLNMVITNFTNSPLLAKAHLDRGWCDWLSGNLDMARLDFQEAAAHLPLSPDQAVARFKLADTQFALKDYSSAVSNYSTVLAQYDKVPEVTNALFDLALYQIAEADIHNGDADGARRAVERILRQYPGSYFGDRGSLLMGEDLNRKNDYAEARQVFLNMQAASPDSPFLPEMEYAIARTYDYDGNWNAAITGYKQWITNHSGDSLLPEVEFHLALACGKAGLTNDALAGFTNFAVRFATNTMFAPWALNWLGDYYYTQKDYISAEKYYQELFKYPEAGDVAYEAHFWAGKSALAGQRSGDARDHFSALVKLTNAPPHLVARAYFALGETLFQQFQSGQTNEDYLSEAVAALSKCTNGAPTNSTAVEALGRMGDYYMAWADQNQLTNNYAIAKQMYETVASFPADNVNVSARSQAEIGLGLIAERQHHIQDALDDYLKVLYFDPDHFDGYWVSRAGEFASRLCEEQQLWSEAVKVYDRVLAAVPATRPVLEKKRAAAQARLEARGH